MIVGTANGRRNPQGLGVHVSLLSIGRAAISGNTTECGPLLAISFVPFSTYTFKGMDFHLDGKLALVSGSTAGIGFAIANALAREGARVIVNGRSEDRVKSAMERIRKDNQSAQLEPFAADLGGAAGAEEALRRFPQVDVLVNNLGIFEPKPFEEISDAEWLRFFEVNVMSGVRLSRAYLARMKAHNWGRIVFISSESGLQIPAEMVHYGVTKTAQIAVARGIAETCAGTGVTCNAVLPGPTASEGVNDFVGSLAQQAGQTRD
jgi:NAD(P)-dependent dehydrogenase (short-subunit alcohol dehydrogenase family)